MATYALPGLGETGDLAWAPVSAILVRALYQSNVLASIDLLEEVLPFTDVLPTATIGWACEYTPLGGVLPFLRPGGDRDGAPKAE